MITAQQITNYQKTLVEKWHDEEPACSEADAFMRLVEENSFHNFSLWHHEDVARRDDIGFEPIYQAKRAIDSHNQQRNNFIEEMDMSLVKELSPLTEGVPFNSETPAMMIDRLSILSLKEYHMQEEVNRTDATKEHIAKCAEKVATIKQQISHLSLALDELLIGVKNSTRSFRVYFQFKMYNDPELNPQLREKDA